MLLSALPAIGDSWLLDAVKTSIGVRFAPIPDQRAFPAGNILAREETAL